MFSGSEIVSGIVFLINVFIYLTIFTAIFFIVSGIVIGTAGGAYFFMKELCKDINEIGKWFYERLSKKYN